MNYVKHKILCIIVATYAISFVICQEVEEGSGVCEVLEGSTCDAEKYCCKQSICNEKEPSTKCCDDTLLSQRPPPSDCSMCPECKDGKKVVSLMVGHIICISVGVLIVLTSVVGITVYCWLKQGLRENIPLDKNIKSEGNEQMLINIKLK